MCHNVKASSHTIRSSCQKILGTKHDFSKPVARPCNPH
ncbi:hypothetical protein Lser_V15G05621 [Lactuca serriola]